jgi:hypothetical protein
MVAAVWGLGLCTEVEGRGGFGSQPGCAKGDRTT